MEPGALLNDAFKEYEVCHMSSVLFMQSNGYCLKG